MLTNLKRLREEYGVSQQRLADAVGSSQQSIHKYETADVQPDFAILKQIAIYFSTTVDYIIGHTTIREILGTDASPLTEEESKLIRHYRILDYPQRECLRMILNSFAGQKDATPPVE